MIVTIKTIAGPSFEVEATESDTVAHLKEKILASPNGGSFDLETLMLIHKGKVLTDADILNEIGLLGSFCVAVNGKKKASGGGEGGGEGSGAGCKPAAEPSTNSDTLSQEPTPAPAPNPTPTSAPVTQQSAPETTADTAAINRDSYGDAASALLTGNQLEQNINQICEIGFERDQVIRAMHAAFNNPDRAVEYLMNGIPQMEPSSQQQTPPPPATGTPQPVGGTPVSLPADNQGPNTQPLNMFGPQGTGGGGGGGGGGNLDFLRNNRQLHVLRQMVAQNPQILQPLLHELGRTNPELLRQINEHQQEFLSLLTEDPQPQVAEAAEGLMQLTGQGGVAGGDPVYSTVSITDEEAAAIERLESLGFDRDRCVEAYLICDKNEEIAANYLLEHADDA